jgi:hypothetical protein
MAKTKPERKSKHVSQEARVKPIPTWRKVPKWVYFLIVAFSVLITLLEGYPWLSIAGGERLNPSNPFSEIFNVTNEGYIPITEPHVDCEWHYKYQVQGWPESTFYIAFSPQIPPISFIGHEARFSAPCYSLKFANNPAMEHPLSGSTMDIKISYGFWPISLRWLRRSQTFHLETVGEQDSLHWQF